MAMNWIIGGLITWAILSPVWSDIPNFYERNLPRMGGIVNADAIAIKSLMKNKAYEAMGNFFGVYPNLTVYFLSFMRLQVVLTRKTIASF